MTDEKLKEVLGFYRNYLYQQGIVKAKRFDSKDHINDSAHQHVTTPLEHLAWMCETASVFVDEGRNKKAMRWLGFIQGVLWMSGKFTIDEMANHSRADEGGMN